MILLASWTLESISFNFSGAMWWALRTTHTYTVVASTNHRMHSPINYDRGILSVRNCNRKSYVLVISSQCQYSVIHIPILSHGSPSQDTCVFEMIIECAYSMSYGGLKKTFTQTKQSLLCLKPCLTCNAPEI